MDRIRITEEYAPWDAGNVALHDDVSAGKLPIQWHGCIGSARGTNSTDGVGWR